MTSERFKRVLKDLKDINAQGGLSQDETVRDMYKTYKVLIDEIFRIGYQDGMSSKEVETIILNETEKHERLKQFTLLDHLGSIMSGLFDENDAANLEKAKADFPHDKYFAGLVHTQILKKYQACTVEERRSICRSDEEFYYMTGCAIVRRCGFKDMKEAFGFDEEEFLNKIPKIKRGNELIWAQAGDPEPELTPKDMIFRKKINIVIHMIVANLDDLYPEVYSMLKPHLKGRLVLNIDNRNAKDLIDKLDKAKDNDEYVSIAAPTLIDGMIIQQLTKKDLYVNTHKRQSIRRNLLKAVLEDDYDNYEDT